MTLHDSIWSNKALLDLAFQRNDLLIPLNLVGEGGAVQASGNKQHGKVANEE
jgi:hypothetical protein